MMTAL